MNSILLDLGALALCALSLILFKETSTYSLSESPIKYEPAGGSDKKSKRVLVGRLLLGIAVLFAGIGLLSQFHGLMLGMH
jgi:hypothetical protein